MALFTFTAEEASICLGWGQGLGLGVKVRSHLRHPIGDGGVSRVTLSSATHHWQCSSDAAFKSDAFCGAWVVQWVKRPILARVMLS